MRRILAAAALIAASISPIASPMAQAATNAASAPADADSASSCAVSEYGYTGYRICGFVPSQVKYSNGDIEYFVVGTNYAVFHIWRGASGWKSLGGVARPTTPNGAYSFTSPVGVATIGTDNRYWCRYRGDGSWSGGWSLCDATPTKIASPPRIQVPRDPS